MFQIKFYIKRYHEYKDMWVPKVSKRLRCRTDKYVVCVLLLDKVVGYLKKGKSGSFAKTIFYLLLVPLILLLMGLGDKNNKAP